MSWACEHTNLSIRLYTDRLDRLNLSVKIPLDRLRADDSANAPTPVAMAQGNCILVEVQHPTLWYAANLNTPPTRFGNNPDKEFYLVNPNHGSPIITPFVVPLQSNKVLSDLAVSPGGERLALMVRVPATPSAEGLIGRILGIFGGGKGNPEHRELWTCNIDGSDMKHIGDESSDQADEIIEIKWSPDERTIAFVHKNRLYTLDAR
jgi:hypothetical protein